MPATRSTRKSGRKVRSARRYYSPSPLRNAPFVTVRRGRKKRSESKVKKNLNALLMTM